MTYQQHEITFVKSGRGKAQCEPDPNYPKGIELDISAGKTNCEVNLPYPAPECGLFLVRCKVCKFSVVITTAGRPDDPIKIKLPCDTSNIDSRS